jgi:hypothetical protein
MLLAMADSRVRSRALLVASFVKKLVIKCKPGTVCNGTVLMNILDVCGTIMIISIPSSQLPKLYIDIALPEADVLPEIPRAMVPAPRSKAEKRYIKFNTTLEDCSSSRMP